MSLKTRYNLFKVQKSLTPDSHFKASLLKKLRATWDNTYNTKYAWYQTVFFNHAIGFATVVLMAGSLGTGAYAYTSPEVTQDSILYPIKERLENIEEIAQITPEAKANFYLKKIERRTEEKVVLQKKNVEIKKIEKVERLIEKTEDKLEQTDKIIVKTTHDVKLREKVRERLEVRFEKKRSSKRVRPESD